jgi:hypothetical protein
MSALHQPVGTITQRRWFNATLVSVLLGALVGCGGGDDTTPVMGVAANGSSTFSASALAAQLATYPLAALSVTESDGLLFMREEEQLAHDVYAVSATLWPSLPIFTNISASEATHSAALKALLDRYQLVDPLAGLPEGSFHTPAFQTLYDTLVAASRVSLIEALKVGVEIEELDIRDITALRLSVDNADILMVYDNLLKGSRNHLRAYMTLLIQQSGTYVPQYISQDDFDAIVNSAIESGR